MLKKEGKAKSKAIQGARRTEILLQERQQEEENGVTNHILLGGYLLVLLATMVVFSLAKGSGLPLEISLWYATITFILGSFPFSIVWMVKQKNTIYLGYMFIAALFSVFCSACTGLWFCLFWCYVPSCLKPCCGQEREHDGMHALPLYADEELNVGCCPQSTRLKRKLDRILCCLCQRGMCLGWTPSCFQCTQCHTPCFTNEHTLRRHSSVTGKRRRVSVFQRADGTFAAEEILPSGEARARLQYTGTQRPVWLLHSANAPARLPGLARSICSLLPGGYVKQGD